MKELCPAEALHEECGVFGIYDSTGKTNMVSAVYSALYALQHRGQESCGIAVNVDGVIRGYRDLGLVNEVFASPRIAELPAGAKMATGHVRYATSGQRTRAALMPDPATHKEKAERMGRLLALQDKIAMQQVASMVGQTVRVLVEGAARTEGMLTGRLDNNLTVEFAAAEEMIGHYAKVSLTGARATVLTGELAK